jgi:hypothetical protein
MVLIKTLQSVSEIRFGRCPHQHWFTSSAVCRGDPMR